MNANTAPKTMNLIRNFLLTAAIIGVFPSGAILGQSDPMGELESEPATVHVPYTASMSAGDIAALLPASKITADINAIRAKVIAGINANADAIKVLHPHFFDGTQTFNDAVDAAVAAAIDQINSSTAAIQGDINTALATGATNIDAAINTLSPKAVISGNYAFHSKQKDPGDPGWGSPSASTSGFTSASASASIGANITIGVTPGGVGISFPVTLNGNVTITATALTPTSANIDSPTSSSSGASCIPHISLSASVSVTASAGLSIGSGASGSMTVDVPRVSGTLVAGEDH